MSDAQLLMMIHNTRFPGERHSCCVLFLQLNHNVATEAKKQIKMNFFVIFIFSDARDIQRSENAPFSSNFQFYAAAKMIIVVKNLPSTKLFDLEKCVDSF